MLQSETDRSNFVAGTLAPYKQSLQAKNVKGTYDNSNVNKHSEELHERNENMNERIYMSIFNENKIYI